MDIQKIAALAALAAQAAESGLVLVGGLKALGALFGHNLTQSEQDAIEVYLMADTTRRLAESRRMSGQQG